MAWPSFIDRFRRVRRVEGEPVFLLVDLAHAARLPQAAQPTRDASPKMCSKCGKPVQERILTTAVPTELTAAWDEAPVVVDGWACIPCGVLLYPRDTSAERVTSFGQKGAECAQAGRLLEAEWWFTRIMWCWPGYAPAYLDIANVLALRLEGNTLELAHRRNLERRSFDMYERAIEAADSMPERTKFLAAGLIGLAERAIASRAIERASRAIATCRMLEGLGEAELERAAALASYIEEERYVFADAAAIVGPHMRVMGVEPLPVSSAEVRDRLANAVAQLEVHYDRVPTHWQSLFMAAMGRAALGDRARAVEMWRLGRVDHPGVAHISREAALAFLEADLIEEAREVNRDATARCETDATLWCNRAVTELLSGEIAEARRCVARSRALDPKDPIAASLERRIEQLATTGRLPRTLAELEGRARH